MTHAGVYHSGWQGCRQTMRAAAQRGAAALRIVRIRKCRGSESEVNTGQRAAGPDGDIEELANSKPARRLAMVKPGANRELAPVRLSAQVQPAGAGGSQIVPVG